MDERILYKKQPNNEKMIRSMQLLALLCFIFTMQIWQMHGFGRISMAVFFLGAVFSCSCLLIKVPASRNLLHGLVYQMVLEIFALVVLANAIKTPFPEQSQLNQLQKIFFFLLCATLILLVILQAFQLHRILPVFQEEKAERDKIEIFLNILFTAVLIGIGLQFLNLWPRWDGYDYYFSMRKVNLAIILGVDSNRWMVCGHIADAYSLLNMFFQAFPGVSGLQAAHLVNTLLLVLNYFLIYLIFKKIYTIKKRWLYPIIAFAFICTPYILGGVSNINLERVALTGILMFLLGAVRNDYFLCAIACYTSCFSKEIFAPIVAVLIFVQLLYEIISTYKQKHSLLTVAWLYYAVDLAIGILWLLALTSRSNWVNNPTITTTKYIFDDGVPLNTFGLSALYTVKQLKGIFLTNLTWIHIIIIVFALVVLVIREKGAGIKRLAGNKLYVMALCGAAAMMAAELLFRTHSFFRYYTVLIAFIYIASFSSLRYLITCITSNEYIKTLPVIIIGILMLVQCYITIDPIMLSVFPTLDTGNGRLVYMPWLLNGLPGPELHESSNYNFQIAALDIAWDRVYASLDLDNSRLLVYDGYQYGNGNTENSIWGKGYEYMNPPAWGVWNEKGQYRELSYDDPAPEDIINPLPVSDFSQVEEYRQTYDKLYYLEMPWGDTFIDDLKAQYPNLELFETVTYQTWRFNVYIFR